MIVGKASALQVGAATFVAGFVLHNGDHMRRSVGAITDHVVWGGTAVAMGAAIILTLVVTGHPHAPDVAAFGGVGIAAGVAATHLLPEWSAFSDSLVTGDVDPLTWIAVLAEIAGAVLMSACGFYERSRSSGQRGGEQQCVRLSGRSG